MEPMKSSGSNMEEPTKLLRGVQKRFQIRKFFKMCNNLIPG